MLLKMREISKVVNNVSIFKNSVTSVKPEKILMAMSLNLLK